MRFFCSYSTNINIAVSFTTLILCLIPPTDDRENSDSTSRLQKVLFLKMGSNKVVPIPKKIAPKCDFSCISLKNSVTLHPKYKYYGKHQYSRYWI